MNAKRIVSLLLALLMLALPLASCGGGDETTTTATTTTQAPPPGAITTPAPSSIQKPPEATSANASLARKLLNEGFKFVGAEHPTSAVNTATATAISVAKAIDKWGTVVEDDFFPREAGAKEIIIGKIRREEATAVYNALYANRINASMDWRITVTADTVTVMGGSDDALVLALDYFTAMLKADAAAFYPAYDSGIQHYGWPVANLGNVGINNYKIVVAQGADEAHQSAAKSLQDKVFASSGFTLPIIDDTSAATTPELIVGVTSRSVSTSAMNALRAGRRNCAYDGVVFGQGNQIAISGGAIDAINIAINSFATDYLVEANQAQLVSLSKLYQKDGIKSLSFGTNDAGDYRIVYAEGATFDLRYVAYKLQKLLYNEFGYDLAIVSDATAAVAGQKEILLGKTNRPSSTVLATEAYAAKLDANGNAVFDAGNYVGVQKMYATMLSELNAQSGDALTAAVNYSGTVSDIALTWAPDMSMQMTDIKGNLLKNQTILDGYDTDAEYELVWSDEFDGTSLDLEKWSFHTPMVMPDVTQHTDAPYVTVKNGELTLLATVEREGEATRENRFDAEYHTTMGLVTFDTMNFSGGYLEMRAKVPFSENGLGEWPSWWASAGENNANSVLFRRAYRETHNGQDYFGGYRIEVDYFEQFSLNGGGWGYYCVVPNLHKHIGGYNYYTDETETVKASDGQLSGVDKGSLESGTTCFKVGQTHTEAADYHDYGFLWTDSFMALSVDGQFYYSFSMVNDENAWQQRVWDADLQAWRNLDMDAYQKENLGLHVIVNHMFFTPGYGASAAGRWISDYDDDGNFKSDWREINPENESKLFPSYYVLDYMRLYQCADDRLYTPDTIGNGVLRANTKI